MAESGSLTVYPGAYDRNDVAFADKIQNESNFVGKGIANTKYAIVYAYNGTAYSFWPFDVSSIPEDARIDSVSCRVKARLYKNYNGVSLRLFSGSTAKGSATTVKTTTATVFDLSAGTWTRDEINSIRLKTEVIAGSSGIDLYIYGADLTVTYTVNYQKFMLKLGGAYNDVARVFKKVSGIWVEQTDLANVVDQTKRLVNGGEYVVELPEGYTRLPYVESTGEQHVDLGVSIGPSNAAKIKTIVNKRIKSTGIYALDGTGFGSSPYFNSFYVGVDASGNIAYGNGRMDETTTQAYDGTWKTFTYSGEGKISISGLSDIPFDFQAPDTALNFFLFAYNQGTNGIKQYAGQISDVQVIEDGVLIRNAKACKNPSGIPGLYDVVNDVFYHSLSGVELKAPGEVPLTFKFGDQTYQFEQGQTWGEWLTSSYNPRPNNIIASGGYVVLLGAGQYNVLDSLGNKVPTTALIVEDAVYDI